jgi:hypothetical protein
MPMIAFMDNELYVIPWESGDRARLKVERQRAKLACIPQDDPSRAEELRILAAMIENAAILGMAEAFGQQA